MSIKYPKIKPTFLQLEPLRKLNFTETAYFFTISLKTASESAQRFVGYCDENYPLLSMAAEMKPNTPTIILIGPEGDFTADEISRVVAAGFVPSTLGRNRLRTETAALYAAVARHTIDALAE